MKTPCEAAQRQMLALTDPERPPTSVQAHLDGCSSCQEWRKQVVQIDRAIPLLPYPASTGKAQLLERLRSEPSRRQRFQWRAWQLTAAWSTAALLLFVLLYSLAQTPSSVQRPPPRPASGPDPWLASLLKKHEQLARADTTRQQIELVADLADDVRDHTQTLVRFIDFRQLRNLADLYGQAIEVGVQRAGDLPRGERRQVLEPIVKQLEKASNLADKQAREDRVGSADHPLITMASAARLGRERLDGLLKDEPIMRGFSNRPALAMLPARWLSPARVAAARGDGPRSLTTAEDLRQFERNRRLLEKIVESGIHLAEKGDLIGRAGHCNLVVARLAEEIRQAANEKDAARVAELTQHLRRLLTQCVASNLAKGGVDALPGSQRERHLLEVGGETIRLLNTIDAPLTGYPDARGDLKVGRKEVEIAIQGRGQLK